jgi:hypothetical protein
MVKAEAVTAWLLGGLSGSQALNPALKLFEAVGVLFGYRAGGFQWNWFDFWLIARSTIEIKHLYWYLKVTTG